MSNVIDRNSFIRWINGDLLNRIGLSVTVNDNIDFYDVEDRLENGEKIYLKCRNEIVSYLILEDGKFIEKEK